MPDKRSHRGPHPEDAKLFAASQAPKLHAAVSDLSWLLGRRYSISSALKLVGDRYALKQRQRLAVMRCACADTSRQNRYDRQCQRPSLLKQPLMIDGYNVLTTIEAALAGGVLLVGRDGCLRDIASMHGSFRKVKETVPAATLLGHSLAAMDVGPCILLLDRPVSNSGRLKTQLERIATDHGWDWLEVRVVANPDNTLIETDQMVATADSAILDRCGLWFNLAKHVVAESVPNANVVDLS